MKTKLLLVTILFLCSIYSFAQTNTNLGTNAGNAGSNNTSVGYAAGDVVTSNSNSFFGYQAGKLTSSGTGTNSFYGAYSGAANTTGNSNSFYGYSSGAANTTSSSNSFYGYFSGATNTTGDLNSAFGKNALNNNTTGSGNLAIGVLSLANNITGWQNIGIGYQADVSVDGLNNAIAIGFQARVTSSNAIQLGNSSVTTVFAGTGANATLIAGGLKITGGTPSVGKVLTSDANGVATWQPVPSPNSQWITNGSTIYYNVGNVGIGTTSPNTNYALDVNGTVNSTSFVSGGLKITGGIPGVGKVLTSDANGVATWQGAINSQWTTNGSFIYYNSGNIGIGTATPDHTLDVSGEINSSSMISGSLRITGGAPAVGKVLTSDATGLATWQPIVASQWATSGSNINYNTAGMVSIGTATAPVGYKLAVGGKIIAEEIVVKLQADWPDYVFGESYKPMNLQEIELYVKENRHLPGVASAEEIKKNGISVGEMNAILLRKIEELTLYVIEQDKKLTAIKKELDEVNR